MTPHDDIGARRRKDRESGQAMVEFALILFPLLLLVVGIIQFGIGLNYWLDLQRISNQGARWAVVNNWPPACPQGGIGTPATCPPLQDTLTSQAIAGGLQRSVTVEICYPAGTETTGSPVRVRMEAPFTFVPLLGIGTITLRGQATMRLEQTPTFVTGETVPCS